MCACSITQSCLTIHDPIDCSLPGSSVHGIFQIRILEWVAISPSRGSSWPRDGTHISYVLALAGRFFIYWATQEAKTIKCYPLKVGMYGLFARVNLHWPPMLPSVQFSSVTQSCPTLCNLTNRSTPGIPVHRSGSLPKLMSIESVMPSSHLILCRPLFLLPPIPMSQLFTWGGQSIGVSASASVLSMNTQDWSPLGWTDWISLQSKGLSRVFSNTTVLKHQFFGAQLSSHKVHSLGCVCMGAQSYPTLWDPVDCSPPGFFAHGILQQEYWSKLPFPPPGDLPNPGMEIASPEDYALQADSSSLSHQVIAVSLKLSIINIWTKWFSVEGVGRKMSCALQEVYFSSISGLCPLDANSNPLPQCDNQNSLCCCCC